MSALIVPDFVARQCLHCGESFMPRTAHQLFCTFAHQHEHREEAEARRELRRSAAVSLVLPPATEPVEDPAWLLPAPEYGRDLPGGGFSFSVLPHKGDMLELRHARHLHAMWTALTNMPHDPTMPMFTLIPTNTGRTQWSVWLADEAVAKRLAGHSWPAKLGDDVVTVSCGQLMRPRAPVVQPGRQRVRVDCLTPVLIRSMGSTVCRVNPVASNLVSTLGSWLPRRLGLEIPRETLRVEIVEKQTEAVRARIGGKFGSVRGFVGWFDLDVNAPARWLLEVAARGLGIGGRTAFGFGRIHVEAA